MLAGSQHAAAGDADERARILMFEVVQLDVVAVFAGFSAIHERVVVIDHAAIDTAGIDRFHHRAVALIGGEVGFHRFQPLQRRFLAFQLQQRADDRTEIGA